jgi:hypothetical protein
VAIGTVGIAGKRTRVECVDSFDRRTEFRIPSRKSVCSFESTKAVGSQRTSVLPVQRTVVGCIAVVGRFAVVRTSVVRSRTTVAAVHNHKFVLERRWFVRNRKIVWVVRNRKIV